MTGRTPRLALQILILLVMAVGLSGWTKPYRSLRPGAERPASKASAKLDFVIVEVSGTRHLIKNQEELTVVRGDKLVVRSATLASGKPYTAAINVVGYTNEDPKSSSDQGFAIDTAEELLPRFSEKSKGEVYAITAAARGVLHGTVYIRLIDPVLKYAVLKVNNVTHILRDGESLSIDPDDMVKVERIETNVEPMADVVFQIAEDSIRFVRGRRVFAAIPLIIQLRSAAPEQRSGQGKG